MVGVAADAGVDGITAPPRPMSSAAVATATLAPRWRTERLVPFVAEKVTVYQFSKRKRDKSNVENSYCE
jgi:hypothetical protein